MRNSPPLPVDARDAATLREWVGGNPVASAVWRRARIVQLSAAGHGPSAIAAEIGCSKQTVITWRERYRAEGLVGLRDAPRSGRPATVDAELVVERTLQPPPGPPPGGRWSTRLLAAELGISNVAVANVWRAWGITPGVAGQVRLGTEPALDIPVVAVVGLHLDPSVRLLALLVDETGPVVAAGPRGEPEGRRIGAELGAVDPGVDVDEAAVEAFVARVDGMDAAEPQRFALLAGRGEGPLPASVPARWAPAVHVVPPDLSWERMAQVACLLAGASPRGAASVRALRSASADHAAGRPLSWVADPSVN